jgi:tripartite-type tricarboxylate transporter receptor subunit TctC
MKRLTVITGFVLAMVAATAGIAQQASYPSRPSRMVIPFGPGGGNDIVARVLSAKLSEAFGHSVIVDNRPGAQGIIAAEAVKTAAPDGYTMLMGPSGVMSANVATHEKLPYAPLKDFVPVLMIGSFPLILVVNGNHPARTVQELVAFAKANPSKINYGSTTALFQLTSELFNQKTSTNFVHIPYKSSGEFRHPLRRISNQGDCAH